MSKLLYRLFSYVKQKQFCELAINLPVVAVAGVVVTVLTVLTVGVVKEVDVPVVLLVVLAVVCDSVVNVVGVVALSKKQTQSFGTSEMFELIHFVDTINDRQK